MLYWVMRIQVSSTVMIYLNKKWFNLICSNIISSKRNTPDECRHCFDACVCVRMWAVSRLAGRWKFAVHNKVFVKKKFRWASDPIKTVISRKGELEIFKNSLKCYWVGTQHLNFIEYKHVPCPIGIMLFHLFLLFLPELLQLLGCRQAILINLLWRKFNFRISARNLFYRQILKQHCKQTHWKKNEK